jgi:hypothetical protein
MTANVEKPNPRNSAKHSNHLQELHNTAVELGAVCPDH